MRKLIVGVVGGIAVIVAACGSDSEPAGGNGTNAKANEASDASADDASDGNTPPPGSTNQNPPASSTCSVQNGADACFACCEAKAPGGAKVFDDAFRGCACKADACAEACAESECAAEPEDPEDGDACATCLDAQTDCEQAADDACAANAACAALADCIETSGCEQATPDGGT